MAKIKLKASAPYADMEVQQVGRSITFTKGNWTEVPDTIAADFQKYAELEFEGEEPKLEPKVESIAIEPKSVFKFKKKGIR